MGRVIVEEEPTSSFKFSVYYETVSSYTGPEWNHELSTDDYDEAVKVHVTNLSNGYRSRIEQNYEDDE